MPYVELQQLLDEDYPPHERRYGKSTFVSSLGDEVIATILEEGQELMRSTFGDKYERLVRLKAAYDPRTVFRLNHNIEPQAGD